MGECLIISGGTYCPLPADFSIPENVIACDRGYLYAEKMNIQPSLIIGDFDSAPFPDADVPVERVPTRKDDTDTMLAARRALESGFREITICCAFGGRLDHTMANIQTASFLAGYGCTVQLLGMDTEAYVWSGGVRYFPCRKDRSLSVFAISDQCTDVSIHGTKYECEKQAVYHTFPIGVSNVWSSDMAEISVGSGILMVMQSKLQAGEHI